MELIIIKTSDSQNIRSLLEEKNINYEIYQAPGQANIEEEKYWRQAVREASQDKERQKEIKAWDKLASKVKG